MQPIRTMRLTSDAFATDSPIPRVHATAKAGGDDVSVPLRWTGEPSGTASFAIEVVDLDAGLWVHWLVVGIPAGVDELGPGASRGAMPPGARELDNTFGERGWGGPQPPAGEHRYRFTVYALDVPRLDVPDEVALEDFRAAVEPHLLASASTCGTYRR